MNNYTRPLVGAIRWDAWMPGNRDTAGIGQRNVGQQVAETLSQMKYHWRVPYFTQLAADGITVSYPAPTMEIFEEEMQYAADAGIDYFAYCMYEDGSGMEYARKFHRQSSLRSRVKMSAILNAGKYNMQKHIDELVNDFQQAYYVKVCGGRPLVYLLEFFEGTTEGDLEALKNACRKAGVLPPYLVAMFVHRHDKKQLYFDAVSGYSVDGYDGISFLELTKRAAARWEDAKTREQKLIPILTAGWDPRPRIERPVTWMQIPENRWAQPPTPEEIAAHLQEGMTFVHQNRDICQADTVLFYAWNENDEGGWLVPTGQVDQDGSLLLDVNGHLIPDTGRLDAIRKVLCN